MVSVTTYRDAGFLPHSLHEFSVPAGLVAQGRSRKVDAPGTDRRVLARRRQPQSNATVNFTEEDPLDPKAVWLNAEHIRALPVEELAAQLLPFAAGGRFPRGY